MNSIEARLYISMNEVQNALDMASDLVPMLLGLTRKLKGRLAET